MDCPNCGTWNPDDKVKCWRCSFELPRLPEKKPRRRMSPNTWLWIGLILFALFLVLQQCFLMGGNPDASSMLPFTLLLA